jgi:hypothetical protein
MWLSSLTDYDMAITTSVMRDQHRVLSAMDMLKDIILMGALKNSPNEQVTCRHTLPLSLSLYPMETRILSRSRYAGRCLRRLLHGSTTIRQSDARLVESIAFGYEGRRLCCLCFHQFSSDAVVLVRSKEEQSKHWIQRESPTNNKSQGDRERKRNGTDGEERERERDEERENDRESRKIVDHMME